MYVLWFDRDKWMNELLAEQMDTDKYKVSKSISHEWNQHNGQNLIECNTKEEKLFATVARTFVCQLLVYGWAKNERRRKEYDDNNDDDSKVNDENTTRKWVLIITSEITQPVPNKQRTATWNTNTNI